MKTHKGLGTDVITTLFTLSAHSSTEVWDALFIIRQQRSEEIFLWWTLDVKSYPCGPYLNASDAEALVFPKI